MSVPSDHILLVDDQADLVAPLARLLEMDRFQVATAPSGPEGLRLAKARPPDLIVLDVDMPDWDGYETCRRLRAEPRLRDIPILFLSGHSQSDDKVRALQAGGDDYIVKPFDFAELKARIVSLLRRARRGAAANPVTGLPPQAVVEQEVTDRIIAKKAFALALVDIDGFRAYNDAYGYAKGDEVLRTLAKILREALEREGRPEDAAAHAGGDDFLILSDPERIHRVAAHLMEVFDWIAPSFYKEEDRERGGLVLKDRRGQESVYPLLRLAIGGASNVKRHLARYPEALEVAQEMLRYVKTLRRNASFFAMDRRAAGRGLPAS